MTRAIGILLLGFIAGLIAMHLFNRDTVQNFERGRLEAQRGHEKAEARGDSLAVAARRWEALAGRERLRADSLQARRVIVVRNVLASPDSTAAAMGIPAAPDSAGRRCLPLGDFAELLAARAALPLCDSALEAQGRRAAAAETGAVLYHEAAVIAREDASEQFQFGQDQAVRADRAERLAWWYAVGGAAVPVTVWIMAQVFGVAK